MSASRDAGVAGEGSVVLRAPGDRAAPQRATGAPVQAVEVPGRDPDPFRGCHRRFGGHRVPLVGRRFRGAGRRLVAPPRSLLTTAFPVFAGTAGPTRPDPVTMTGAARPVVVATVRGHPTTVRRYCRNEKRSNRQARKQAKGNLTNDAQECVPCAAGRRHPFAAQASTSMSMSGCARPSITSSVEAGSTSPPSTLARAARYSSTNRESVR